MLKSLLLIIKNNYNINKIFLNDLLFLFMNLQLIIIILMLLIF